ncbi:hypothetical protein DUI87_19870 [Hirundo rustica rustica]|uniref:Uncharacterized protein n=1 Tax=Hirundo rustica rustica TaxID=333673 RepID=A0A3M0JNV4_HIRRU|nr:hypothetical protein DUI87_19870 [Hirundo rustica rustica]
MRQWWHSLVPEAVVTLAGPWGSGDTRWSLRQWQVKDQNKKVANLKHKEQVEKKKSAQMLEEARRREDNLNDSSQQLQDNLRKKDDRIEELEEALRESVQITAEREMVLAQEESARINAEKQVEELMMAMEKVKQELESMKAKLSSTQQSLAEKETHLTNLRAERRKHLEEVLEMKQDVCWIRKELIASLEAPAVPLFVGSEDNSTVLSPFLGYLTGVPGASPARLGSSLWFIGLLSVVPWAAHVGLDTIHQGSAVPRQAPRTTESSRLPSTSPRETRLQPAALTGHSAPLQDDF